LVITGSLELFVLVLYVYLIKSIRYFVWALSWFSSRRFIIILFCDDGQCFKSLVVRDVEHIFLDRLKVLGVLRVEAVLAELAHRFGYTFLRLKVLHRLVMLAPIVEEALNSHVDSLIFYRYLVDH